MLSFIRGSKRQRELKPKPGLEHEPQSELEPDLTELDLWMKREGWVIKKIDGTPHYYNTNTLRTQLEPPIRPDFATIFRDKITTTPPDLTPDKLDNEMEILTQHDFSRLITELLYHYKNKIKDIVENKNMTLDGVKLINAVYKNIDKSVLSYFDTNLNVNDIMVQKITKHKEVIKNLARLIQQPSLDGGKHKSKKKRKSKRKKSKTKKFRKSKARKRTKKR